ncbi:lactonase family protein [Rhodoferax aquaticus]|uniref:lactonase family protein n=1 Tax=Rhodoferax aquaticus TaxID=2527691 RepID=UPI00143D8CC0|nr:beta-propeller fold lactonase family protein [Rhodoferax aquaticus]
MRLVYATNANSNTVTTFSVNASTGALTTVGSPVATGNKPQSIVVHASGSLASIANTVDGSVTNYSIQSSNGALTAVGTALKTGAGGGASGAYQVLQSQLGYVYVSNSGEATVNKYESVGGNLVSGTSVAAGTNPRALASGEAGSAVYVANNTTPGSLRSYTANNLGNLTAASTYTVGNNPSAVLVYGSFVYVANSASGASSISGFSGGASTLASTVGSPYSAGGLNQPSGLARYKSFLYAANYGTNTVSGYTINANGSLTALTGSPFVLPNASARPLSIYAPATGESLLYVGSEVSNDVTAFTVNANTGALTVVGSYATGGASVSAIASTF